MGTRYEIQYRAEGVTRWTTFGTYNLKPEQHDIDAARCYCAYRQPTAAYEIRVRNPHTIVIHIEVLRPGAILDSRVSNAVGRKS